jgi:hypothetical protein
MLFKWVLLVRITIHGKCSMLSQEWGTKYIVIQLLVLKKEGNFVFSSGDVSCSRRTLLYASGGAHNVKTQNPFSEEPQNAQ